MEAHPLSWGSLFWNARNPLRWAGYFVCGQLLFRFAQRKASRRVEPRDHFSAVFVATAAGLVLWLTTAFCWSAEVRAALQITSIYLMLFALLKLGKVLPPFPCVRWLAESSYPTYLYHLFFVQLWRTGGMDAPTVGDRDTTFALSLVSTLVAVWAAKRLLGDEARFILGRRSRRSLRAG